MTWLYLSILAAFIWAVVNTIDKIIVSRRISNPLFAIVALGFVKAVIGAVIVVLARSQFTVFQIIVGLLAGASYIAGTIFYFHAIRREEASRIVPMFALGNVWTPLFAAVFLGEIFSVNIYLGILTIIVGSFLIMWKPGSGVSYSWYAVLLMGVSTLGYTFYSLAIKYLVGFHPFWIAVAWPLLGSLLITIPLTIYFRSDIAKLSKKTWAIVAGDETLNTIAIFVFALATVTGFVSLVNAALASQYVFIFIFGLLFSRFLPRIAKEDLKPSYIFLKLFATLLIVAGVVVIALKA